MKQEVALDLLKTGRNIFLTGAPGTGKTFVLNKYINYIKRCGINFSVTAPTGIAASHLNGTTLHSFAGLGLNIDLNDKLIKKILANYFVVRRLKNIEILIIDEVSMLNPNVFCAVDKLLKVVKKSKKPFGGIQVVLSGDFFQLPPIYIKNDDFQNKSKYIWQIKLWQELNLCICYLDEVFRYRDKRFVNFLREMRSGKISQNSKKILEKSICKKNTKMQKCLKLYTHNTDVDKINKLKLSKLNTKSKTYKAGLKGEKLFIKNILSTTLVSEILEIKIGARVIFIKNNEDLGYVNGTNGYIIDFDKNNYPVVKTKDKIINVKPEEWIKESDSGEFLAGVKQIPLKLAWALTVHKSQGMTIDCAIIDLSYAFEVGQGYVALSRLRGFSGLFLEGINHKALEIDKTVLNFDRKILKKSSEIEKEFLSKTKSEILRTQKEFIYSIK